MSALGGTLAFLMFVGAANEDATPEQRSELRDRALPPLSDRSLTASEAYEASMRAVVDIMGPDWRPTGEWDEAIANFLGWSQ